MAKRKKYTGRAAAASGKKYVPVAVSDKNIGARKQAADSMKRAGVQSLSGLSGSQGQVARFKTEQNNLRREYNNQNTSDQRKEEIVKDLRGVSRNLNDQSRAAALNQVIREFGPGSITNTGGIMGSDAGARFQQLRGNPNFYQDGVPGLETFVGTQGAFKRGDISRFGEQVPFGDKNLFKQVHPNPLKILLGAATQAGNISPLGLVRNINKIRTGQPLIDMSFMDRNTSESPSRLKNFYNAYMDSVNKKIQNTNNEKVDAVPLDPQVQDVEAKNFGEFLGDPTRLAEDKDIQEDMDRSLFNQYSLLQDDSLADSLLDETEETDLAKEIIPSGLDKLSDEEIDQRVEEMIKGFNFPETPKKDYQDVPYRTDGIPVEAFKGALLPGDPRDPAPYGFEYKLPEATSNVNIFDEPFDVAELTQKQVDFMRNPMQSLDFQSRESLFNKIKQLEDKGFLGFGGQEPTTREEFEEFIDSGGIQTAADGGSVNNTYNTLKLINDTMNQGV
jgi:hypothetical protein